MGVITIQGLGIEFVFQILGTILLLWVLKKFTYKAYKEYIQKRKEYINSSIDSATNDKKEAKILKETTNNELQDLRNKSKEILDGHKRDGKRVEEEMIKDAKRKSEHLIKKADEEIIHQKKQVESELSQELLDMTVIVSEKILKEKLNSQKDEELIQEALEELKNV